MFYSSLQKKTLHRLFIHGVLLVGFLGTSFVSCDFLNNNPALLSFSYSSEISAIYGDDEDAKSTAPAWTSFPGDSIAYRIEGPPNPA